MGKLKLILLLFLGLATTAFAQTGGVPPNAQPGKCYAKCYIPEVAETTTEQVVIKSASTKAYVVPATFETKPVYQLVKDASKRMVSTPARYETVTERVEVKPNGKAPGADGMVTQYIEIKPAGKRFTEVPATYESVTESYVVEPVSYVIETMLPGFETVTERIETKPAGTKWVRKKADADCLSANPDDCLVYCLVETPAEYQTLTKRINKGCDGSGLADAGCIKTVEVPAKMGTRTVQRVKTPMTVIEENVPAEYKAVTVRADAPAGYVTITRQIEKTPASYFEEYVPATYKAVTARVMKTPPTSRTETIPAEYVTVTKRKIMKAGGFTEWREVLCGEKMTTYTIKQVQAALNKAGYDAGPADNAMGTRTKNALTKFQKDKGLPVGNFDFETLKALGINY